jgi:outer membrane protein TolC
MTKILNFLGSMAMVAMATFLDSPVSAQDGQAVTLTLCYEKAIAAYPQLGDRTLLKDASDLRVQNISSNYLPQLSINGQATYQSDVTKISLPPLMGISVPSPAQDQYKVTLDAQQLIYDGGLTRKQKKLEEASSAADIQQIETDLLRIKEQVNNTFFTIVLLQENRRLLQNTLNVLKDKEQTVKSMVKNGVLMKSDENTIIAERLKTEQLVTETEINRASAIRIMNLLTSESFTDSTVFMSPELIIQDTLTTNRPEIKAFELQEKRVDAAGSISNSSLLPKVFAFGQLGYGRPGLNMMDNGFNDFYMVGASLKWNFWDWNKSHREKQVYTIQKQMVATKRDNFNKNLAIDLQSRMATIKKSEEALKRDADIVELRASITQVAQSQLSNGVITSSDYVTELNSETQARINLQTHKIQLIQAKANYLLATGNL